MCLLLSQSSFNDCIWCLVGQLVIVSHACLGVLIDYNLGLKVTLYRQVWEWSAATRKNPNYIFYCTTCGKITLIIVLSAPPPQPQLSYRSNCACSDPMSMISFSVICVYPSSIQYMNMLYELNILDKPQTYWFQVPVKGAGHCDEQLCTRCKQSLRCKQIHEFGFEVSFRQT